MLGIFGLVGASIINEKTVSANDIVMSVTFDNVPFSLNVVGPKMDETVNATFPLVVSGGNIDTVDVYIELDSGGSKRYEFLGNFIVNDMLDFANRDIGSVKMPNGLPSGQYNLKFVGYQHNGGDAETAQIVRVNYVVSGLIGGGGGGSWLLPNVPNTGLFRVGNKIVMSSDVLIIGLAAAVVVLGVLLVKKNRELHDLSKKSAKNQPTKRVRSKKYSK
jgi:hypothetical protein